LETRQKRGPVGVTGPLVCAFSENYFGVFSGCFLAFGFFFSDFTGFFLAIWHHLRIDLRDTPRPTCLQ
jgi:hypothetical protein